MLPLILGLIGFLFHLIKNPKGWFVIFLLFLLTGIAIVIYLNQKPAEPREEIMYAASFYAFAVWIGLGVWALFDFASANFTQLKKIIAYAGGGSIMILIIQSLEWNDLRSYLSYMSVVSTSLALMYFWGRSINLIFFTNSPIVLGVFVPVLLYSELGRS